MSGLISDKSDCNKCVWGTRDGGCASWECEFIDRDDAVKAWRQLSSAEPEITRCKDCSQIWQSGTATINGTPTKIYKCKWWDNRVVSPYGFCYMAERRTDETD